MIFYSYVGLPEGKLVDSMCFRFSFVGARHFTIDAAISDEVANFELGFHQIHWPGAQGRLGIASPLYLA